MHAGEICVLEIADVVVADQVETWFPLALEEGGTQEVECRVPVVMLDDLPGAEDSCEIGISGNREETSVGVATTTLSAAMLLPSRVRTA